MMNRRDFLGYTSRAAAVLPFMNLPDVYRSMKMGIVVHSYAHRWNSKIESQKYPGFKDAIDLLEHSHEIGAGGIQVVVRNWSEDFSKKVRDRREKLGLYLEGSVALPKKAEEAASFEKDILAAKEAGASVIRTVCLNGRRYENFESLQAFNEFARSSMLSLQWAEPIVRKNKVKLAIENHKDWRAPELLDMLRKIESEWVGVNIDFGNNVALVEDPMTVVKTLAPYVFSTHVKDMGVKEYSDGFLLSEVPLGEGVLDLKEMFEICKQKNADVTFNLEMITRDPLKIPCLTPGFWETLPSVSAKEVARTMQMVRQRSFSTDLPTVSQLNDQQRLAVEEENILESLRYSQSHLGMS